MKYHYKNLFSPLLNAFALSLVITSSAHAQSTETSNNLLNFLPDIRWAMPCATLQETLQKSGYTLKQTKQPDWIDFTGGKLLGHTLAGDPKPNTANNILSRIGCSKDSGLYEFEITLRPSNSTNDFDSFIKALSLHIGSTPRELAHRRRGASQCVSWEEKPVAKTNRRSRKRPFVIVCDAHPYLRIRGEHPKLKSLARAKRAKRSLLEKMSKPN